MKIYLDEPIVIDLEKIGHTYEGLKYLIDHYTQVMNIATPQQLNDNDRQHCERMIEKMKLHVALYEKQKALNP